MRNRRYARILWNLAFCLFVYFCLWSYNPAIPVIGVGKLIALLICAGLLLFVVEHSQDIHRAVATFFEKLRLPLFWHVVEPALIEWPLSAVVIPNQPVLPPLFQRPPPISSL